MNYYEYDEFELNYAHACLTFHFELRFLEIHTCMKLRRYELEHHPWINAFHITLWCFKNRGLNP